jgi:hypothetical protein
LNRQDITKLDFIPLTYTKSNGELVASFSKLNIWTGTKKLTLTAIGPEYCYLNESEIQWLANELERWTDIPQEMSKGEERQI